MSESWGAFTPLADSAGSQEMDRLCQRDYGISAELLMESAGVLSAHTLLATQKKPVDVLVLCGPGNNGADGLVTARHLLSNGLNVEVFVPASKINNENLKKSKKLSLYEKQQQRLINLRDFREPGLGKEGSGSLVFKSLEDHAMIAEMGERAEVIVDALFGVGLSRDMEEPYVRLIEWINAQDKFVVSLDTPSGLNVDTGCVRRCAVQADLTLSFGLSKPGFYLMQGPSHVGKLKVFSIGFPSVVLAGEKRHFLIKKSWVSEHLPRRGMADHKAQHGHLLVVAGSEGFWGAGVLAGSAGYRMGVGYVTLSSFDVREEGVALSVPSDKKVASIFPARVACPPTRESRLKAESYVDNVLADPAVLTQSVEDPHLLKGKTAVAIGPGLGVSGRTKKLLRDLMALDLPVVVDACAWRVCVRERLFPLPSHWVVTPHSGELAELFGLKGWEVDQDRCFYAMKGSVEVGCLMLLKGFYSVLAHGERCWIIPTGNMALAKAGTGDVLTGFIGALMARGCSAFVATAVGAFVHGLSAEEWVKSGKDPECLMAQDLKDILPYVLQQLRKH